VSWLLVGCCWSLVFHSFFYLLFLVVKFGLGWPDVCRCRLYLFQRTTRKKVREPPGGRIRPALTGYTLAKGEISCGPNWRISNFL